MTIVAPLCGVYLIRCGKKVYIGSSKNIHVRWQSHRNALRQGKHSNSYLQNAWAKHGEAAFTFEVLELCLEVVRCDRENYWMQKLKATNRKYGYNSAPSAIYPGQLSPEACAKISASKKGKPHTAEHIAKFVAARTGIKQTAEHIAARVDRMRGRVVSPETRAKIAASNTGKIRSTEARARYSAMNKGRKHSLEFREKISAIQLGKKKGPYSDQARQNMSAAHRTWTDDQARHVQQLYASGLSQRAICEQLGLTMHVVWRMRHYKVEGQ